MGYFVLSNTIATAIGPFLAMFLGQFGSYGLMFAICSGTMILSVLMLFLLKLPKIVLTEEQKQEYRVLS
jgi:MFS family permease